MQLQSASDSSSPDPIGMCMEWSAEPMPTAADRHPCTSRPTLVQPNKSATTVITLITGAAARGGGILYSTGVIYIIPVGVFLP